MQKANKLSSVLKAVIVVMLIIVVVAILSVKGSSSNGSKKLNIVAGENFWGSLVSQIGGKKVNVYSIVSDPNADPHEYEVSSSDALKIAKANFVILNGVGYDSWANKLLAANPNSARKVVTVGDLFNKKVGDNPHLWYNPSYVNVTIKQVTHDLIALDPKNKDYYNLNYRKLVSRLQVYQDRIKSIKEHYSGVKVAATEDIFYYLAEASGLDLVSPPAFTEAVAEGNDPPASSIVQFEQQLSSGEVKVLVYNEQTVTPLTTSVRAMAAKDNIPIVGITETIQPPNMSFENWMNKELIKLQSALSEQH